MSVDLRHGDCVELMRQMPDCSVDSVVTDPPYELGFMGKAWDGAGIAYSLDMWREVLRVLKPGSHLLAFGGTRTYHRMACAIEDAGFEIRDSIHWVYGSGFPKSLNVGKAIDRRRDDRDDVVRVTGEIARLRDAAGLTNRDLDGLFGFAGMAGHWTSTKSQPTVPTPEQWTVLREALSPEQWMDDEVWRLNGRKGTPGEAWGQREVVGERDVPVGHSFAGPVYGGDSSSNRVDVTAPATDEAKRWEGWGTALKPAHEPVVVARKPLSGTVAGNVLTWGTGGLNIDGCRVGTDDNTGRPPGRVPTEGWGLAKRTETSEPHESGRWPANIVLDGAAAAALDQQSGTVSGRASFVGSGSGKTPIESGASAWGFGGKVSAVYADRGGASRFFTQADFGPEDWPFVYQAKPSKRERNAGLDGLPEKRKAQLAGSDRDGPLDDVSERFRTSPAANSHPTVKPVALMRHLVRLVTPPGGTVLDPFAGSGTTLVAAVLEGMNAIGCEMTDEYLPIIEGRVAWAEEQAESAAEAAANPEQPTLL